MAISFEQELERWGPVNCAGLAGDSSPTASSATKTRPQLQISEARTYCQQLARTHYENFPVATWMLPRSLRQDFCNIYAYCRWSDDLADEIAGANDSLDLLAWWKQELHDCYAGSTRHPVFVALKPTIDRFQIPLRPFEDLLSAFEQDQRVKEYDTFDQLLDYCRRSANPVGRLVLYLCRAKNDRNVAWSDSVCTGLQLANFWQDVARDFDMGRVYLPKEDRGQFGYSDDELNGRVTNDAFLNLMQFEVERTRPLLESVFPLARQLSGRLQIEIELFGRGGLRILDRIEEIGFRVWDQRPVISKWDIARLLVAAVASKVRHGIQRWQFGSGHPEAAEPKP